MKIVNKKPPNYAQIVKALPAVKKLKGVVFTYGHELYYPSGTDMIPPDLMVHEHWHEERQINIGIDNWWDLYLNDVKFRAEEELGAYQRQYKYARRHYSRSVFQELREHLAKDLSGDMYGKVYDYKTAYKLIVGKYV